MNLSNPEPMLFLMWHALTVKDWAGVNACQQWIKFVQPGVNG